MSRQLALASLFALAASAACALMAPALAADGETYAATHYRLMAMIERGQSLLR